MKIVIDTNVVISGVFFGGMPRRILEAVVEHKVTACATREIIEEYDEIVEEMIIRKQGHIKRDILKQFVFEIDLIQATTKIEICRDPDDDKFLSCAVDGKAYYIVSGDKDLLSLESYGNIEIITASEFCRRFL